MASGGENVSTTHEIGNSAPSYLVHAKEDLGKTEQAYRKEFNKRILDKLGFEFDVVTDPWCACWVGVVLEETGYPSTKKANARSYLSWGQEVSKDDYKEGDIVVFWRGTRNDGTTGHVGFLLSSGENTVTILGGNQSDEVKIQKFAKTKILGVRRYRSAWTSRTVRAATVKIAAGAGVVAEGLTQVAPSVETASSTKTLLEQALGYFPNMTTVLGVVIILLGAYVIYRKVKDMKNV